MPTNAPLDWKDIKTSAAKFSLRFKNAEKEESYKQLFWSEFLAMFGIDSIQVGMFEQFVRKLGNSAGEIDYFWPGKVIIEHKSAGKNLEKALDQALEYMLGIEKKDLPRYIIVSDFKRIRLIDLVDRRDDTIKLEDLADNVEMFGFLAGYNKKRIEGQHPVNVKAAEIMGRLYDELKESNYPPDSLDILMVRLVFCLFAEDADVFDRSIFSAYLAFHTNDDGTGMAGALTEIFSVLDTPLESRQKTMSKELMNFPYVNGGLFAKQIPGPSFNREMRDILLEASKLDWKFISPAIFGSLFQCIMDPSKRRELGAHYTSEENILRVINPLFMNDLRNEFEISKGNKKALQTLWDRISHIRIMDPACGCGNFLIISYREMRRLEMDILDSLYGTQNILDESHLHIDHYYGIEIGEFASMVANLSIILMDHLMNMEMRNRFGLYRDILPLKEKANIVCANSLQIDWKELVNPSDLTYIVGNPPFLGYGLQTKEQKEEMLSIFVDEAGKPLKTAGKMDYVCAWYRKSAEYIAGTDIRVALVSTNSITQGEQVAYLWGHLLRMFDICIDFAYRTFKWSNEARGVAAVHCVIIGFSRSNNRTKRIYDGTETRVATNISPYLVDAPNVIVESSKDVLCDAPSMMTGNRPADGGHLIIEDKDKEEFISKDPKSKQFIRPLIGSEEFINKKKRWCLWLKDVLPQDLKTCPEVMKRIQKCKEDRESSPDAGRRKLANTPSLFREQFECSHDYVVIPAVSSEKRQYVPIGYVDRDVICTNLILMVPDATKYHFAILTSRMHMVWMRYVCGRLKSDYRYSRDIVYNTFPWPNATEEQKTIIERLAQEILDTRSRYPDSSYADLYDPLTMPEDLRKAHETLDKEVDRLYKSKGFEDDNERISQLFELYKNLIQR
ncbi:MAG: class I SAM-dependent DNA methyltransferase [Candidatus Methanomethylophilaceae archaeon]|nr:class I SAM-dependent DNA methyltransferase [Candidatus Methanomethylophilaceae archaeon]